MHCKRCGAEALDSSLFCRLCGSKMKSSDFLWRLRMAAIAILIFIALLLVIASLGHAQTRGAEQQPRQVWIRLKSGPILTGDLVKMDPDSVDFKVKGVLQSVKCDDLIGVMFIPPTPRPGATAPTPSPTPAPAAPAPQPAPAPRPPTQEVTPDQFPDHCKHEVFRLDGGKYHHITFFNRLRDFHYTGEYTSHGGKISVYIVDSDNLAQLVNHHKFQAFYSATKVTDGKFDVPCQQGEDYHLVFVNESIYDSREIEADLCFTQIGK